MPLRITENTNPLVAIEKMAAGNPGAMTVMAELLKVNPAAILWLDQLGIYDSRIWQLYCDACKHNIKATAGLLKAWRSDVVAQPLLMQAADGAVEFNERQLQQMVVWCDTLPPCFEEY